MDSIEDFANRIIMLRDDGLTDDEIIDDIDEDPDFLIDAFILANEKNNADIHKQSKS